MPRVMWESGVYCWHNRLNGKVYVGSAISLVKRLRFYLCSLPGGYCHNRHLQSAWKKYGSSVFVFRILESCAPSLCIVKEQVWIDFYKSYDRRYGYNSSPTAGSALGVKHSEESRVNHQLAAKKRLTIEVKSRISASLKEYFAKDGARDYLLGKRHSEETKRKIAEAVLAQSEETRAKRRAAWVRRKAAGPVSQETRDRISAAVKGKRRSPQTIARMREAWERRKASGWCHPAEARLKMSMAKKGKPSAKKGKTYASNHKTSG